MKEERFPHTRKPLHWWRKGVSRCGGGNFRTTEENAVTGVQRAKWRDSYTEDRCQPALTSLGLRRSDPRERTGVGCVNTA